MKKSHREILAWCCYDWASSAFPIIITTFIFATYFATHVAANTIEGTYQWANATALAGIIIAICSPLLGAIADHGGHHKRWLGFFTLLSIVSAALLWFAAPSVSAVIPTLICVVVGTIGLEIALVFYNSFLPTLAPAQYLGRISGWAWGLGYLGGILALSLALFIFIQGQPHWLNTKTAENVRICGPLVALWFGVFSIPLFLILPDTAASRLSHGQAIRKGLAELYSTLKTLPQQKNIFLFLVAHMIYIDGLNTLFAFGGIYASTTLGMNLSEVILFGITMNLSAGIGAIALAFMDDAIGSKPTILLSLICLVLIGIPMVSVSTPALFWCCGLLISLFLGPVQAASRSLMTRIMDKQQATEMFGLYAFSGRITSFIGPWLLGMITLHTHSQRYGMASILIFFIVGGILLTQVIEPKKR